MKSELARLLGFTAENLLRLAMVTAELERRGEDLDGLKLGILPILRLIASGTLLPGIVVMYAGYPLAMKKVAKLPLEEQQRIMDQGIIVDTGRKGPSKYRPRPRGYNISDDSGDEPSSGPNLLRLAAVSNPKDIGEMAATLVRRSTDPQVALQEFAKTVSEQPSANTAVVAPETSLTPAKACESTIKERVLEVCDRLLSFLAIGDINVEDKEIDERCTEIMVCLRDIYDAKDSDDVPSAES